MLPSEKKQILRQDVFTRDFIANFTHQLMGPLQSIEGHCQNLAEHIIPAGKKTDQRLLQIVAQSKQCIELVRNMAQIAEILSEDRLPDFVYLDGASICKHLIEIATNYQAQATFKNCKIEIDDPSINQLPKIAANLIMLKQVVGNLIDNAVKYCDNGSIIKVNGRIDSLYENIIITVTNSGIGIISDDKEEIFKAKYRGKNAMAYSGVGTGAGLYLVKRMMDKMDGSVVCDGISAQATKFSISFPIIGRKKHA